MNQRRSHSRHGLKAAKAKVNLGGTQEKEAALIEMTTNTKLLLDSIDDWLLKQPSLVNARKRAVHPVVLQRQQIAADLARFLDQLGLKPHEPAPLESTLERLTVALK